MLKYQQVVKTISDRIYNGTMKPGAKLLSIRKATEAFDCNKATIIRAYQELESQHLIYSVNKSGYYVVDSSKKMCNTGSSEIDFFSVELQKELIPYKDFQHCLNHAIERDKANLFCYCKPQGLDSLIEQVRKTLMNYQVFADPNNIIITSGVQQAIDILCRLPFCKCRDRILVEQPTFHGVIHATEHSNTEIVGIERTYEGIDLNKLEHIFRTGRVKFFYLMPRYHNPLGTSLSLEQRQGILELARKYDVYLVEDDYLADYDPVKNNDPMAAGNLDRVIYLKSFSKIFLPGLRVGVAVLPEELRTMFADYKRWTDLNTSILSQGALEVYLKSGLFEKHIQGVLRVYQERMAAVKKIMDAYCEFPYHVPDGGMIFSIEVDRDVNVERLLAELEQRQIRVRGTKHNFMEHFRMKKILRLSISNVDVPTIEKYLPEILAAIPQAQGFDNQIAMVVSL